VSKELAFVAGEVPEVRFRGQRVSSSRIRQLLAEGKVNLARRMLGRPYGVEGRVEHGVERGHQLGFPTANLHPRTASYPGMVFTLLEFLSMAPGGAASRMWGATNVWDRNGTFG